MPKAIIDFEFTGLDNTFITDNEIIQMKVLNIENGKHICWSFGSDKNISAYSFLSHGVLKYETGKFCQELFFLNLNAIGINDVSDWDFYGYSPSTDLLMLNKYGIKIEIKDIRQMLQLSKFESRLAIEGSGLESAYVIATGKIPRLENHNGIEELLVIEELYDIAITLEQKEYFTVMPFGHCAGMPIFEYVAKYRRQADGYRLNNNDLLAKSLNYEIQLLEQLQELNEGFHDPFDDDEG